jgi:phenylacetate-CoA ligase
MRNLRALRRNTWLPTSELEKIQLKALRRILKYAYENVAFYHHRFDAAKIKPENIQSIEDMQRLPVLTKRDVQRNLDSLIARNVRMEMCKKETTSGTTGTPLSIVAAKTASSIMGANKLRHQVENGSSLLRDKYVLLLPVKGLASAYSRRTYLGGLLARLGFLRRRLMDAQEPVEDVMAKLRCFGPDVIDSLPSFFLLLMKEMKKGRHELRPQRIFTSGELLDARSRALIKSAFQVDVIDVYGCTEASNIAWECPEHTGYHTNIDLIVPEFVKEDAHVAVGEAGKIVLTPLWNFAMPLIRYDIGDVGRQSSERCPCGRGLPLMEIIEGRYEDFIVLPSGRMISPYVTSRYFEHVEGIEEYKIIQQARNRINIQLVLREKHNKSIFHCLEDTFKKELGKDITISIEAVDSLPKNGKRRHVVSNCCPRELFS